MTMIKCEYCGIEFNQNPSKIKKSTHHYCSLKCNGLDQSKRNVKKSIGARYGKVTVISFSHTKNKRSYVNCICDCGNKFIVNLNALKSGNTKSCNNCPIEYLFMNKVKIINKYLWIWNGCKFISGYGQFHYKGKCYRSHRLAYEMFIGKIPEGKICCHKDDRRDNVSPYNLFISDNQGNSNDMVKKGRQASGEKNRRAKLTNKEVLKIRELYKSGEYSKQKLANIFGVVRQTIYRILAKESWKNI